VLSGSQDSNDIYINPLSWYEDNQGCSTLLCRLD